MDIGSFITGMAVGTLWMVAWGMFFVIKDRAARARKAATVHLIKEDSPMLQKVRAARYGSKQ